MMATTALVTGASRGLGVALVRELLLADDTAHVLLTARTPDAAAGAAAALHRQGFEGRVVGHALDVSDARAVLAFAREHEEVDLLINNAAVCPTGWNRGATSACWRTNVLGPLALTGRGALRPAGSRPLPRRRIPGSPGLHA